MPHRSPIIFWLLLAATLSVNAVAYFWMAAAPHALYAEVAYDALIVGQLSVVCIWSGLRPTKTLWSRTAPLAGVLAGAAALAVYAPPTPWIGIPYYGLHAAMLLALLWVFERTDFWRRRSGIHRVWRYSVAHLLIAMTVVAVLTAALRESRIVGPGDLWINVAFLSGSVAVAILSVICWSLRLPLLVRKAAIAGCGIVLAIGLSLIDEPWTREMPVVVSAHYLIQAGVLAVWLTCWPILPIRQLPADDSETAEPPTQLEPEPSPPARAR